jgi:uncharacterized MnhB-related membrane protein
MIEALNAGVALLILALAAFTTIARDLFAAAVGFIAYGLLLTLVWVQLQGLDVALIEGAVGGGLTGALMIGAASRLRQTQATARGELLGAPARMLALLLSAMVAAAVAACVLALPGPAPTLAPQVAANMAATGVGNPVTAVLLALSYR